SQVNANTAASGVGLATTGGILLMSLSRSGTGKFHVVYGLTAALNQPVPQINRTAQTMTQGRSAKTICSRVGPAPAGRGGATGAAESSRLRRAGEVQIVAGCQICRKPTRQAIDTSEAMMSTSQGFPKFDTRNCGTANDTPHTRMAGQICIIPRKPAN